LCTSISYDTAHNNNRILTIGSAAVSYDAAGNLTLDPTVIPSYNYQWDAEGRMTQVTQGANAIAAYTYNALGQRAETLAGTLYNEFLYDPAGNEVGRNDRGSSFFWQYLMLGSRPFGKYQDGITYFHHSNHLGTTAAATDETATVVQDVVYYPWGQQWLNAYPDVKDKRFASLRQDDETGLHNTPARKYNGSQGRWLTPDPSRLSAFIESPQTWNMYSYAYNNPLQFADTNGRWPKRIHEQIIDAAFQNLSPAQRQILKDISKQQDSILGGGQGNALAFQHAMSAPGQSAAEAEVNFQDFVSVKEDEAMTIQIGFWLAGNQGLSDKALAEFGAALHDIVDSTSPAHEGFQVWNWKDPVLVARHSRAEQSITPAQGNRAILAAQNAFVSTFLPKFNEFDLLDLIVHQAPAKRSASVPKGCVETYDSASGTTKKWCD
jgi:RHS repeat-associated protein